MIPDSIADIAGNPISVMTHFFYKYFFGNIGLHILGSLNDPSPCTADPVPVDKDAIKYTFYHQNCQDLPEAFQESSCSIESINSKQNKYEHDPHADELKSFEITVQSFFRDQPTCDRPFLYFLFIKKRHSLRSIGDSDHTAKQHNKAYNKSFYYN